MSGIQMNESLSEVRDCSLFFYMESIDAFAEKVRDKVEILYETEKTFYGRKEISFQDLNGYDLVFLRRQAAELFAVSPVVRWVRCAPCFGTRRTLRLVCKTNAKDAEGSARGEDHMLLDQPFLPPCPATPMVCKSLSNKYRPPLSSPMSLSLSMILRASVSSSICSATYH